MNNCHIILKNNSGFKWYNNQTIFVKGYFFNSKNEYFEKEDLLKYFKNIKSTDDFIKRITEANGSYSVIIRNKDAVYIAVDKIRTFPLFYSFRDRQLTVSDFTTVFADTNKEIQLDKLSVTELKASGFVSGKYTLLQDIYQVKAGEIVTVTREKIESNIYYTYSIAEPAQFSFKESRKKLETIFGECFRRLLRSINKRTVVVPLSGGYDSRLIAVMLKSLGFETVICYTYGRKSHQEINISKKVAEQLNYKWYFIEYSGDLLSGLLDDEIFIKYFPYNTNHHTMIFLQEYFAVKYLKKKGLIPSDAVFLPGHSGDFLAGSQLIKNGIPESNVSLNQIIKRIIKKKYNILPHDNYEKNIINERIRQSLESYNLLNKQLCSYSVFEDWDFKEKLAKVIFNSSNVYSFFGYEYRFPFWDNELVDFFKNLHFEQKIYKKLYDEVIKTSYFDKYNLNFETEFQPKKVDFKSQKLKDLIKRNLPGFMRKKLLLKNDIFATEHIAKQLINDLKKQGSKIIWGTSINSIQIQWYLEKVKLQNDKTDTKIAGHTYN